MEPKILDDHAAFNRFQVMQGRRLNESGTKPSIYITEVKLKKLFNGLFESELRSLFKIGKPMNEVAIARFRKKLCDKLELISDDRILTALNIYLRHEDGELCARYVLECPINKREKEE